MHSMQFIRIIKINLEETIYWTIVRALTQPITSIGRAFIIEHPYKLLVTKYVIYHVGLLASYSFKNLLSAPTWLLQTPYCGFNELILFNI